MTLTARNRISRRDLSELARELFGIRLSVGAVDAICRRGAIALAEPHEALVASVLRSAGGQRRRDRLDRPPGRTGRSGPRPPPRRRSSGSPRIATATGSKNSSASGSPASAAPTAGGPTTTSTPKAAKRAGATSSETSASTPKGSPPRSSSASTASSSPAASSKPGTATANTKTAPGSPTRSRPIQTDLRALVEEAGRKTPEEQVPPRLREQPPEDLARALDVRHPRGRRTDQQRRRTITPRARHPPQTLPRHPQPDDGERFIERALSASVTCRLQKRSLFAYLTDLLTAHARGDPLPTLT